MDYQFESIGPGVRIVELVFLIVFVLLLLGMSIMLAALPGRIASSHRHPQARAINMCGWLGLPTRILRVLAMIWVFYRDPAQRNVQMVESQSVNTIDVTGSGQLTASGVLPTILGSAQQVKFAVKIQLDNSEGWRVPGGAQAQAAVYTDDLQIAGIPVMFLIRTQSWLRYVL